MVPRTAPTSYLGGEKMASIAVFFIAFGVGCLTGVVVGLLSQDRRRHESTRALLSWVLPGDD